MINPEFDIVLKYAEHFDEFIKIRVIRDADVDEFVKKAPLTNKEEYYSYVVDVCILDHGLNNEFVERLTNETSSPITIEDANESLYFLSTEINPIIDISNISMVSTMDEFASSQAGESGQKERKRDKIRKAIKKVKNIDKNILKEVIGQDHAVNTVCNSIKKSMIGLRDPYKPIGSFLFCGNVGVGKTELAKSLTYALYGNTGRLVRVDCSEYGLPHEYAKLIGSPPGYIGHNEGGYLTEAAKEMDEFVVLFDEIEKAHSKMHNILLQILDEGAVTDSKGFKVSFKNAIVIMTCNVGVSEYNKKKNKITFDVGNEVLYEDCEDEIDEALRNEFRPEFLNRIDHKIVFNTLTKENCVQIAWKFMELVKENAEDVGIQLDYEDGVAEHIVKYGYDRNLGAREIHRIVRRLIEEKLSDQLLREKILPEDKIVVRIVDDRIHLDNGRKQSETENE